MATKIRTQIQLDPDDLDKLRSLARRRRISVSEAVRQLVREASESLVAGSDWARLLKFAGSLTDTDGQSDVAENHDRYLYGPVE